MHNQPQIECRELRGPVTGSDITNVDRIVIEDVDTELLTMTSRVCLTAMLTIALMTSSARAQTPDKVTETVEDPVTLAGLAERDISPKVGMERPGNYFKQFHKAFHDACKVRAAVFDDGRNKVALVSVDALIIRRPQVEQVRKRIHEETGILPGSILIAATHSHSSGPTGMLLPGEFGHADDFVQRLAYVESTVADAEYLQLVEKQIVAAVVAADRQRTRVRVGFASGHEDSVSFNRRFRMRNKLTYTNPRPGNPDIVEPAGPIDPQVGVIGVWDDQNQDRLIGCIVNFACHAATSPPGISANYVYYLEQEIRGMMGDETIVVFLAGASGDINAIDNRSPYRRVSGQAAAKLVGGQIGAEAVKQLLLMGTTADVPLASTSRILSIPRRRPAPERVAASRRLVQQPVRTQNRTDWVFAKEIVLLDALIAKHPKRNVETQALQVGPAVFVTTPAEYFCQFGLDQKRAIHFPFTFPVSLANGCVGYVPTDEAFASDGGGYETRLTSYSNLVTTAGRLMANTGIDLANSLTPGPVPQAETAPAFKEPWSYGAVPPEIE